MNRNTGVLIAFLVILSLALAYNTVTQTLVRAEKARQTAQAAPAVAAKQPAAAGCATGADGCSAAVPPFEPIQVAKLVSPTKLVGDWLNVDKGHRGLTRITFTPKGDRLTVTPWALHRTGEKPYSEAKQADSAHGNPFEVTWEAGFADTKARFALMDNGRLRVDSVTMDWDLVGTRTPIATEFFVKATPETLKAHQKEIGERVAALVKAERAAPGPKAGST
jgi:hypothetical protein